MEEWAIHAEGVRIGGKENGVSRRGGGMLSSLAYMYHRRPLGGLEAWRLGGFADSTAGVGTITHRQADKDGCQSLSKHLCNCGKSGD